MADADVGGLEPTLRCGAALLRPPASCKRAVPDGARTLRRTHCPAALEPMDLGTDVEVAENENRVMPVMPKLIPSQLGEKTRLP